MVKKLINCDLGECLKPDKDGLIMPLIDMANIASGGHAGDNNSIRKTIKLALKNKVIIGAHPSYNDKKNFGRLSYNVANRELFTTIKKQILNFKKICFDNGADLKYLKPHGTLYHDMMKKTSVLHTICMVIKAIDPKLALILQAGVNTKKFAYFAKDVGINFYYEAFADRAYDKMKIISRSKKGAVLDEPYNIVKQYQQFLHTQTFKIDTICFHSDNLASIEALRIIKNV